MTGSLSAGHPAWKCVIVIVVAGCQTDDGESRPRWPQGEIDEVQISYSCVSHAGPSEIECKVLRTLDGGYETDACVGCFGEGNDSCDGPIDASGMSVSSESISLLKESFDSLEAVKTKTSCIDHYGDLPSYRIRIEAADGTRIDVSSGGNCGPFFVEEGGRTFCDCTGAVYDWIWNLIGGISRDLLRGAFDNSSRGHCSCTRDFFIDY